MAKLYVMFVLILGLFWGPVSAAEQPCPKAVGGKLTVVGGSYGFCRYGTLSSLSLSGAQFGSLLGMNVSTILVKDSTLNRLQVIGSVVSTKIYSSSIADLTVGGSSIYISSDSKVTIVNLEDFDGWLSGGPYKNVSGTANRVCVKPGTVIQQGDVYCDWGTNNKVLESSTCPLGPC